MDYNGDANAIPRQVLRTTLTKQFDAFWTDGSFSSAVTENIPFFPLDRFALREVLQLKLREMALIQMRNGHIADLVYDADVLDYLTSPKYINYLKFSIASGNSSIIVAEKGGRAIVKKGPLSTLQAYIFRYMPPWKETSILHIGVEKSYTDNGDSNDNRLNTLGAQGADPQRRPFIFLQWCHVSPRQESNLDSSIPRSFNHGKSRVSDHSCPDPEAFGSSQSCSEEGAIVNPKNQRIGLLYHLTDMDIFAPNACETKWIGHLEVSQY